MGDYPTLQHGSEDKQWVDYLRECLNWQLPARGSSTTVQETDVLDDAMLAAVKEFQELAGLTADGVVGDATWEALVADPTAAEGGTIILDFGDHDLTANTYDFDPSNFWMGGTNVGTALMPAGAYAIVAEVNGKTWELRTLNDSPPGEYFSFFSEDSPDGWDEGCPYTVTAPQELGGATKSGMLVHRRHGD